MTDLRAVAEVDRQVGERVRVRRWAYAGRDRTFASGAHRDVEIAWVARGALRYRVGRSDVEVPEGSTVLIPAETEHATTIYPTLRAASIWVSREMVRGIASSMGRRHAADAVVFPTPDPMLPLGELLRAEAEVPGDGRIVAVEALTEALLVSVLRATGETREGDASVRDPRIEAAVERIRACYAEPLSVDDLASTAGMSRYHFSRAFRAALGESPYRYLVRVRVERAAELLHRGRSVSEAALDVGFNDLGRFARTFRERFGHPPSEASARSRAA